MHPECRNECGSVIARNNRFFSIVAEYREYPAEIAANPPLTVRGIKDVLDQQRVSQVSASLRYVAAWNAAFLPSKDLSEGISATFAKRPPKFTGE